MYLQGETTFTPNSTCHTVYPVYRYLELVSLMVLSLPFMLLVILNLLRIHCKYNNRYVSAIANLCTVIVYVQTYILYIPLVGVFDDVITVVDARDGSRIEIIIQLC